MTTAAGAKNGASSRRRRLRGPVAARRPGMGRGSETSVSLSRDSLAVAAGVSRGSLAAAAGVSRGSAAVAALVSRGSVSGRSLAVAGLVSRGSLAVAGALAEGGSVSCGALAEYSLPRGRFPASTPIRNLPYPY